TISGLRLLHVAQAWERLTRNSDLAAQCKVTCEGGARLCRRRVSPCCHVTGRQMLADTAVFHRCARNPARVVMFEPMSYRLASARSVYVADRPRDRDTCRTWSLHRLAASFPPSGRCPENRRRSSTSSSTSSRRARTRATSTG